MGKLIGTFDAKRARYGFPSNEQYEVLAVAPRSDASVDIRGC